MGNLKKKMAKQLDMPLSSFGSCPYMEIEGNGEIKIDGCLEILSYDEEKISLQLSGLVATIIGQNLTMRSYASKTIRIIGTVKSITLD